MKLAVRAQDIEKIVTAYLADALGEDIDVGIQVPSGWTSASRRHLQVVSDGSPLAVWPIITYSTVRLIARCASTSAAKDLCALAQGHLLSHPANDDGIASARFLTGPLAARDPQTKAELAASTTRVGVRTAPIESGS